VRRRAHEPNCAVLGHEIALYVKAFEQLRGLAVYGAEARALIVKAIEALK
jgi:hypothetical protein